MANPHYRYFLELNVKSTTKAELVKELETLIEYVKEPNAFGASFGGDSGTCYSEGNFKAPTRS